MLNGPAALYWKKCSFWVWMKVIIKLWFRLGLNEDKSKSDVLQFYSIFATAMDRNRVLHFFSAVVNRKELVGNLYACYYGMCLVYAYTSLTMSLSTLLLSYQFLSLSTFSQMSAEYLLMMRLVFLLIFNFVAFICVQGLLFYCGNKSPVFKNLSLGK